MGRMVRLNCGCVVSTALGMRLCDVAGPAWEAAKVETTGNIIIAREAEHALARHLKVDGEAKFSEFVDIMASAQRAHKRQYQLHQKKEGRA